MQLQQEFLGHSISDVSGNEHTSCSKMFAALQDDTRISDEQSVPDLSPVTLQILKILFSNRRLLPGERVARGDLVTEMRPHVKAINDTVRRGKRLTMILPGFPAKSPNRYKTLGALPDFAEKHALTNLRGLCQRIERIYAPGARVVICSDGRVFSDLVRIPDQDVTAYSAHLSEIAHAFHKDYFGFFNLDDVYPAIRDFDCLREEILIQHGESIESLRKRCKKSKDAAAMYRGITRFIFEDYSGLAEFNEYSRSAIQRKARIIAYRVIQRSNAWTRLLESRFEGAVRLSIHPQFRISKKIGVFLVATRDCWQTPWHSVAVKENGDIYLMKRIDAERKALLAFEDGRPSHFEVPPSR